MSESPFNCDGGPTLLNQAPSLFRLKEAYPGYISRAIRAQATARRIAKTIIEPQSLPLDLACQKDPRHVDWDLWRELNREKISVCMIPKALGGLGWGFLDIFCAMEEFVAADVSITAFFMFNLFGPVCAFVEFKPEICLALIRDLVVAQRQEKPLFFAWALTEPSCGSDNLNEDALATQKPSIRVRRVSGGYRVSGVKHFISNGSLAERVLLILPVDPDRPKETFSCFFVKSDAPGFSVGRVEHKMGHRAKQTAEIVLDNVFIPDCDVWERPGRGWRHTMEVLAVSTAAVGMLGLGLARGSLDRCINFCRDKKIDGKPLIEENWVKIALADMLRQITVLRSRLYDFAVAADTFLVTKILDKPLVKAALAIAPEKAILSDPLLFLAKNPIISESASRFKHSEVPDETVAWFKSMGACAKVSGTDLAIDVSGRVLDIVGLRGAAHGFGMEKIFRDSKPAQIYEGTNQVNLLSYFKHEIGGGRP